MGIILPQFVKIRVGSNNYKYYLNKKYNLTVKKNSHNKLSYDFNQLIDVYVMDLMPAVKTKVKVQCDNCGDILLVDYGAYNKYVHEDGCYFCQRCSAALFISGPNSHLWNPNLTDEDREYQRNGRRNFPGIYEWKRRVFLRDDFACQNCGSHENPEAHHIESWNSCNEKRIDVTNGITLCKKCHNAFHNLYGRGNNTKEQLEEWLGHVEIKDYKNDDIMSSVYSYNEDKIYSDTKQYAAAHNIDKSAVYSCCIYNSNVILKDLKLHLHTCKGNIIFWDKMYKKLSRERVEFYIKHYLYKSDEVVLLNTKECFSHIQEAADKYSIHESLISGVCNHRRISTKKLNGTEPMVWMYKKEYDTLTLNDINNILLYSKILNKKMYINITTGRIFYSRREACNFYDIDPAYLSVAFRNVKIAKCGKNPVTNSKYEWMFFTDFVKLSQETQIQILKLNPDNNIEELISFSSFLLQKIS